VFFYLASFLLTLVFGFGADLCYFLVFPRLWKGPSERRWVGLGFCPFCAVTLLRAGVDGFTRFNIFKVKTGYRPLYLIFIIMPV